MSTTEASDHDCYNDTIAFAAEMLASICRSEGEDWTYWRMHKGSKRKWTVQSWQEGRGKWRAGTATLCERKGVSMDYMGSTHLFTFCFPSNPHPLPCCCTVQQCLIFTFNFILPLLQAFQYVQLLHSVLWWVGFHSPLKCLQPVAVI